MDKCSRYFGLLVILTSLTFSIHAQNKDIEWLRQINIERNQSLDPTFKFLTHTTTTVMIGAPLSVLGLGLIKNDSVLTRKGLYMISTVFVNSAFTIGFKLAVHRPRPFVSYPEIVKLAKAGSYSFPSGHTSSAFSSATSLFLAFPKWYVGVPAFVWAIGVGYSRMHLGVHYPSDVAAGALIGAGSAYLCYWLNKKIHVHEKKVRWI